VLSIYVHEMGHIAALRRLGIAASAPMFIPGLGAFVRMKQYPATVAEDAEVGLAGPVWGLAAAVACWAVFLATDAPIWAALARTGGWINLFNMLPVWQLDGGRGFRALDRRQRWLAALAIGVAWYLTGEMLLLLLGLVAALAAGFGQPAEKPHPKAFYTYAALIAALSWLAKLHVPTVTT
jgi:Zn-dependent protease